MKKMITKIMTSLIKTKTVRHGNSDFSDFFMKKPEERREVITQILREVNEEQRKTVEEYHKQLNRA